MKLFAIPQVQCSVSDSELPLSGIGKISDDQLVAELTKIVHPNTADWFNSHVREHRVRFRRLLTSLRPKSISETLLDIGGTGNLLPLYLNNLQYKFVAIANKWRCDALDPDYLKNHLPMDRFRCDYFDAESEPFPYDDASFDSVVCSEVIEHLQHDPAHMLAEINRVLKIGGKFVLTTPNITSSAALYRLLSGIHPQTWSVYTGKDGDRHNREYTPREIAKLLEACGFSAVKIETFSLEPDPLRVKFIAAWASLPWVARGTLDLWSNRGAYILAVCAKQGAVRERFPAWLYEQN